MNVEISLREEDRLLVSSLIGELIKYNSAQSDFEGVTKSEVVEGKAKEAEPKPKKEPKADKVVTASDIKKIKAAVSKATKSGVDQAECVRVMREDFETEQVDKMLQSKRDDFLAAIAALEPAESSKDDSGL